MALEDLIDPAQVRSLLDKALAQENLPDEVVLQPVYAQRAVNELLLRDPDAESHDGDGHVTLAINFLVAALLAEDDSLPVLTAESYEGQGSYSRKAIDLSAKARVLRDRYDNEITAALGIIETTDKQRPTMFTLACGRRGR